jgi:transposase
MIATPLCAMQASQALVLQARGVSRSAVITRIGVHHGKSTTYDCTGRYNGSATPATGTVSCGAEDRVGEHVLVVRAPGG